MSQVHELCETDLAGVGLPSSNKGREVPVTGILGFQEGYPDTKKRLVLEGWLPPSPFDPGLRLFFGFCLFCLAIGSWHLWLLFPIPSHLMLYSALRFGSSWPSPCSQVDGTIGFSLFLLGFPRCEKARGCSGDLWAGKALPRLGWGCAVYARCQHSVLGPGLAQSKSFRTSLVASDGNELWLS